MTKKIFIKDIIEFLNSKGYKFKFIGEKEDEIIGFSTLFNYKDNTLTFISSLNNFGNHIHLFKNKKIKLIITDPSEYIYDCFSNVIQINNPKKVFFSILDQFFDTYSETNDIITSNKEVYSKQSFISNDAIIGENVKIGVGCVIEGNVYIGDNTIIHHNVVIKSNTKIGKNCTIFSGAIIGERGFGPMTLEDGTRVMLKHYGGVTIGDNVHIGDNCCIIRGTIDDTIIKDGAKLNTMVHVAHNCIIGKNTIITMPTHICGSVSIGDKCHIAASVIRNQLTIGEGAVLGLGSVVVKDVDAGETVVGNPAKPIKRKR